MTAAVRQDHLRRGVKSLWPALTIFERPPLRGQTETEPERTVIVVPAQVSSVRHSVPRTVATLFVPRVR